MPADAANRRSRPETGAVSGSSGHAGRHPNSLRTRPNRQIRTGGATVREYWLVDRRRQLIEQYALDEAFTAFEAAGTFKLPDTITARTLPGFAIPVRAIFDQQTNRDTLRALLA